MFAPLLLIFILAQQAQTPVTPSGSDTSQPAAPASSVSDPDVNGVYHRPGRVPGMTPPEVTYSVEPEFTKEARKKNFSGHVLVGLIIDVHGIPTNVHVIGSAAEEVDNPKDRTAVATLDQKAVEAVLKYRFKPAVLNGKPVPSELHIAVNFQAP